MIDYFDDWLADEVAMSVRQHMPETVKTTKTNLKLELI